jgi:hypothetical protein
VELDETFIRLDKEIAKLVRQLQRERLERIEKAGGAIFSEQPPASTEHRGGEERTVRGHHSGYRSKHAAIESTTLGSIARHDRQPDGHCGEAIPTLRGETENHDQAASASAGSEPHCNAIAEAMPENVLERSFQRSGPGGIR